MDFKDLQKIAKSIDKDVLENLKKNIATSEKEFYDNESNEVEHYKDVQITGVDGGDVQKINPGNYSLQDWEKTTQRLTQQTGIPAFSGYIENGYDTAFVTDKNKCPRCDNKTTQHYSQFVYGTKTDERSIYNPSGYFCSSCSTVIVDQEMIKDGVATGYKYNNVLGLDPKENVYENDGYFKTWNGKECFVVFDDDNERTNARFAFKDQKAKLIEVRLQSQKNSKNKNRKKKKQAKLSKKKNKKK